MEKRRKTVEFATGDMIESKKVVISLSSRFSRHSCPLLMKDRKKLQGSEN